jgi:hypothetical protein
MKIQIGPDLSVTKIDGTQVAYVSDVFRLKTVAPEMAAMLTEQHFADAGSRYPELKPAIKRFLAENPLNVPVKNQSPTANSQPKNTNPK